MEMLELIVIDGRARGIVMRDLVTGKIESFIADAVVLATGGYGNVFYLSTNAKGSNAIGHLAGAPQGRVLREPLLHADPPDLHPEVRRLPVEADAHVASRSGTTAASGCRRRRATHRPPDQIPEDERDYYLERIYPTYGNLAPRDISSRQAKNVCDDGRGVGPGGLGVYLDFRDAFKRLGRKVLDERYGNLFEMYERITGEDPHEVPMRIYPAVHYTMGGLWVDYNLMSNVPGLFVGGEANFSDHGANRLGASALMQGLADGYFVLPATIGDYLATRRHLQDRRLARGGAGRRARGQGAARAARLRARQEERRRAPPRARQRAVERLRHGALEGEPHPRAAASSPTSARSSTSELQGPGLGRGAEPGARAGRPRRRLLRARRAPLLRRAPAQRVVRRPLPRRVPDAGRRGAAQRRGVRVRGGLGVDRGTARRRTSTRKPLQFENIHLAQRSYK